VFWSFFVPVNARGRILFFSDPPLVKARFGRHRTSRSSCVDTQTIFSTSTKRDNRDPYAGSYAIAFSLEPQRYGSLVEHAFLSSIINVRYATSGERESWNNDGDGK
jgi:hypothetical protein